MESEIGRLQHLLSADALLLSGDYAEKLRVLKELNYVDPSSNMVSLKGKVACEIHHQVCPSSLEWCLGVAADGADAGE